MPDAYRGPDTTGFWLAALTVRPALWETPPALGNPPGKAASRLKFRPRSFRRHSAIVSEASNVRAGASGRFRPAANPSNFEIAARAPSRRLEVHLVRRHLP